MEATLVKVSATMVSGLACRTSNFSEMNPLTAKLPSMWGQFISNDISNKVPNRLPNSPVYGIYSNYDSDVNGNYTTTVGVPISSTPETSTEFNVIEIQEGDYLAFEAKGVIPAIVVQTWIHIWTYFTQHPEIKRRYGTDFEVYNSSDSVTIYIGIAN